MCVLSAAATSISHFYFVDMFFLCILFLFVDMGFLCIFRYIIGGTSETKMGESYGW